MRCKALCFIFVIQTLPSLAAAQKQQNVQVNWYKPQIGLSAHPDRSRVILSGKTKPGSEIRLATDEIPLIDKKGEIITLKAEQVSSDRVIRADHRGLFDLNLDLPFVTAQIPIEVKSPDGQIKQYQLNLQVLKEETKITNQKNVRGSPYARRTWGIWGGLGYNYLNYKQQSADIPSDLTLESFNAPTLYGKIVRSLTPTWAFQATFNQAPGQTASSETIRVEQGSYNWTYLTGEFTFFHPKWKMRYKKYFSEFGAQWGLQYHLVPFISRSSATDATTASVETNDIIMVAVGGTWLIHYDRYWLLETFLRYQVPYSSGRLFDIAPDLAFDGSVGLIYKWKPDWRIGAFWYGQWHDYSFRNHVDKFFQANGGGGPKIDGDQTLFFSNLEFRVGWEFD